MKKIVVAIDGFSSCGKSTMAKALAKYAGYAYIDTGAMYRAVALYAIRYNLIDAENIDEIGLNNALNDIKISFKTIDGTQHTHLNGEDVESQIRTLEVANGASRVSAIGFVRRALVKAQQEMGNEGGVVMDGRDIGTVVFPNAELKIFVTASAEIRAQRRYDELKAKGEEQPYADVLANVEERDYRDTHRVESPLRQADDARLLDNSNLNREEQFELIKSWFNETINK
ncbi:MAG: (d)CMP kinase [Paludibacteraceae bacterium]|nr:(d)CMP kinase [Paludibacteraceae bacterium]